jgi:hypothetical protein
VVHFLEWLKPLKQVAYSLQNENLPLSRISEKLIFNNLHGQEIEYVTSFFIEHEFCEKRNEEQCKQKGKRFNKIFFGKTK